MDPLTPVTVALAGVSFIGRLFTIGRKKPRSPAYKTQEAQVRTTHDTPVPIVYGLNKVTGHCIYREDTEEPIYDMAVAFCEGEVEEITDVKVDGLVIEEIDDSSVTTYTGTSSQTGNDIFKKGLFIAPCEADAYTSSVNADTNYNGDDLCVQQVLGTDTKKIYLRFNFDDMPAGLTIESAKIRLALSGRETGKADVKGYALSSESWDEDTITYTWAEAKLTKGSALTNSAEIKPWRSYGYLFFTASGLATLRTAYNAGTTLSILIEAEENLDYGFGSKESSYVSPALMINFSGGTPCGYKNTAYAALRLDNRSLSFTGLGGTHVIRESQWDLKNRIPEVTALVKGLKIKNWNTDTEAYQTTYNNNPAWVLYDLLTNDRYGVGLSESLFDTDSFKTVAAHCDGTVTLANGDSESRYECDIVIDSQVEGAEAIEDILATFGGFLYYVDGTIHLGVEKNEDSDHTVDTDTIIFGSFSYSQVDKSAIPNIVRVLYTEPAEDFKQVYVKAESEIDRTNRGEALIMEMPLLGINRKTQAQRRANLLLWRGLLEEWTCRFRVSIKHSDICVGDIVTITHPVPDWTAKDFRVVETDELDNNEIEITCIEYIEFSTSFDENLPEASYYTKDGEESTPTETIQPTAPTWTLAAYPGGWRITITEPFVGALRYPIYYYNEDTLTWTPYDCIPDDRGTDAQDKGTLAIDLNAPDPAVRTYRRFKVKTVTTAGQSDLSDEQNGFSGLKLADDWTPTAPTLETDGYPLISYHPVQMTYGYTITNIVLAASGESEKISSYELRRTDDGGSDDWTNPWEVLPERRVMTSPAPQRIKWKNTDKSFKIGYKYRYQARATGLNGISSAWSDSVEVELTDDTTAPDQPTITVENLVAINLIYISEPGCDDFSHWKIEGSEDGGDWQDLDTHHTTRVYVHAVDQDDLDTDWSYRVTAYDFAGNASTVSAASDNKKHKEAGLAYLATEVKGEGTPGTLSQITVNAGNITTNATSITTNASNITTNAGNISTNADNISVNAAAIDLRVEKSGVIAAINLSEEGITIDADNIAISGSTTFSSGYDPSEKLKASGGSYESAASGARIEIFPDANTGIQVIDTTPKTVFKVDVGGASAGDVLRVLLL